MTKHRASCESPGCGRVWRENCRECAQDTADRHRADTGHPVAVTFLAEDLRELREMTRRAHRVLHPQRVR